MEERKIEWMNTWMSDLLSELMNNTIWGSTAL